MRGYRSFPLSIPIALALVVAALAGPLEDGLAADDKGDWQEAVRLLEPLAKRGNVKAQEKLGRLYQRGKGVERDYAAATDWYRKSAIQGDAAAQARLGFMLWLGVGTDRDYQEAFTWYRRSAEQGNRLGQVGLGYMAMEGVAMAIDYATAAEWFRRAALQGDALAMLGLATLYENGRGVPLDPIHAWAWYDRASKDDGEYEQDIFERAARSRDDLAERMTPAQIAEAKKFAARP